MTPEITWTQGDWATADAWYGGEQWVLLKSSRRDHRGPAGWYLHATEGPDQLADDGRFISSRIEDAKHKATAAILSERIAQLQDALKATDRLELSTREDVTLALAELRNGDTADALDTLGDLLESLGGEAL